jgi:uncharacterized protein (TIGR03086 family)
MTDQRDRVTALIDAGRDREAAIAGAEGETMDPLTQFGELGPTLAGVVGGIRPDQLDNPTPCADFSVRGVLEHMIGGATVFAAAYRGQPGGEQPPSDVLAEFGPVLTDLAGAITAPGALDRVIASPFGDVAGEWFARYIVLDGLVHGWDLATATGQRYDPPAAVVDAAAAYAHEHLDGMRDGVAFGPAVEPAPGASPIERLVAFTGRRPLAAAGAETR